MIVEGGRWIGDVEPSGHRLVESGQRFVVAPVGFLALFREALQLLLDGRHYRMVSATLRSARSRGHAPDRSSICRIAVTNSVEGIPIELCPQ